MRWIFFFGLAISAASAYAQEQENKLVDRLLRPDMSLSNSAQDKKFTAVDGTPVEKKFGAESFYSGKRISVKSFSGSKRFSSKKIEAKKFSRSDAAVTSTSAWSINAGAKFAIKDSSMVRTARESGKAAKVRDYPDNRPFLAKGTRQKALSEQDKPLTIEQVRELLNKSN